MGNALLTERLYAQRRRSILALGLVLAGVGALAGAWAFTSFSHRADVLAAARDIPAGTRITAAAGRDRDRC